MEPGFAFLIAFAFHGTNIWFAYRMARKRNRSALGWCPFAFFSCGLSNIILHQLDEVPRITRSNKKPKSGESRIWFDWRKIAGAIAIPIFGLGVILARTAPDSAKIGSEAYSISRSLDAAGKLGAESVGTVENPNIARLIDRYGSGTTNDRMIKLLEKADELKLFDIVDFYNKLSDELDEHDHKFDLDSILDRETSKLDFSSPLNHNWIEFESLKSGGRLIQTTIYLSDGEEEFINYISSNSIADINRQSGIVRPENHLRVFKKNFEIAKGETMFWAFYEDSPSISVFFEGRFFRKGNSNCFEYRSGDLVFNDTDLPSVEQFQESRLLLRLVGELSVVCETYRKTETGDFLQYLTTRDGTRFSRGGRETVSVRWSSGELSD